MDKLLLFSPLHNSSSSSQSLSSLAAAQAFRRPSSVYLPPPSFPPSQIAGSIEYDRFALLPNDSGDSDYLFSQNNLIDICLRRIFLGFLRAEIPLSFALDIATPLIAARLALLPLSTEVPKYESIADQINHSEKMALEGIHMLRTKSAGPYASSVQESDRYNVFSDLSLYTDKLPVFPDSSIAGQFPPQSFKLSKGHRNTWAGILKMINNDSLKREKTVIHRFENTRRHIFLLTLSYRPHQRFNDNLNQAKNYISNTIERGHAWHSKKMNIEEGTLAWITESYRKASRTLLTLSDQSWLWLVIYRPTDSRKRTIDKLSKRSAKNI